ncbi:MAG: hypothetical protein A2401_02575 [Candidatus Staskawiczbacteria bacterium RIFOXYC1_FULL_38_18]|uniref:SHS2 domain-containing protein n=1 Tax=Candidatus Staskawiczbacteria bacterium RIFOXYC1_FULL_38_18 TaxID=1802229 RepID=A0A1G2JB46_9BACT|nr:MAG: hypothetical protein A2401_02575 [Candidatus Staskawiczbacteria bacterium RIFOXYC1_FULL_38_18]
MKNFLRLKSEIFGLDIGDFSLKIVKLKERKGKFVLASFNEAEITPGIIEGGVIKNEAALADIIKKACVAVKGEKLNTKYVVASLPEEKSFLQVIQMPEMNEKELKSAALFEVENYIPLPLGDIYVDFQKISLNEKTGRTDVLIVAMPKPIVDSYVSCIKKAGLTPFIMEPESQATARAVVNDGVTAQPLAIVGFGGDNANFIIYFGNSIRFTCSIPVSSRQITDAPVLDNLALQIKKYMDFYSEHFFHDSPATDGKIGKVIIAGGGAGLNALSDFLSKKLSIPVETANALKNVLADDKTSHGAEILKNSLPFATAIGLAERGAVEGKKYPHI